MDRKQEGEGMRKRSGAVAYRKVVRWTRRDVGVGVVR